VKKLQKGFTLIELMIVIAIIAILAAILIPNFLHARAEAQTAACEGNEKQIATALEEYAVDHNGSYPAGGALSATDPGPPYLNFAPKDPVNTSAYNLTSTAGSYGSYQINDQGGHDTTTTIGLFKSDGTKCTACASITYNQNAGIVGQ
jgi:prepilin-type N-terminal cleavage/methylation domain-containing protein